MALSKGDKEWIVRTIKDIIDPFVKMIDHLKNTVHGETGQNGLCGKQKELLNKQQDLERSVLIMAEQMKQIRSTAIFWTRLVGGAALAAISVIIVQLLLK